MTDQTLAEGFGLDLFELLQEEYRTRPFREPVPRDTKSFKEKAAAQVKRVQRRLGTGLEDKVVLELGCGHGWLTAFLPKLAGVKKAIGVDPRRYEAWDEHVDPRVELIEADMAVDQVVAPGSIDFLVSGAVMEHVTRPVEMLAAIQEALRPGGRAWLYFNLHRGPQASHRYNDIYFPWPHLLFESSVCKQFYAKHLGRRNVPFAWVNRLTIAEYLLACRGVGLGIVDMTLQGIPIDVGFYSRFEDELGRYPALDLETDFATLILEKPAPGPALTLRSRHEVPQLDYLGRQRALAEALDEYRAGSQDG